MKRFHAIPLEPPVPARSLECEVLSSAITQGILATLGGLAVLVDGAGRILAASEDAQAALNWPLVPGTGFPGLAELDLAGKGLCGYCVPVPVGAGAGALWVFKDIRARLHHDGLEAAFLQGVDSGLRQLEGRFDALGQGQRLTRKILVGMRALLDGLQVSLEAHRNRVLPRHRQVRPEAGSGAALTPWAAWPETQAVNGFHHAGPTWEWAAIPFKPVLTPPSVTGVER